jgi:hypothetical protein
MSDIGARSPHGDSHIHQSEHQDIVQMLHAIHRAIESKEVNYIGEVSKIPSKFHPSKDLVI